MGVNNDHKSDEDATDFLKLMQDAGVTPIEQDHVVYHPKKTKTVHNVVQHRGQNQKEQDHALVDVFSDDCDARPLSAADSLSYCSHGIQKSTFRKFSKGRFPITDELDLHGLTSKQARELLLDFLEHTLTAKNHCVRVIHGKGHRSTNQKAILKTKVNHWLQQHQRVLAFHSCMPADGGTGAVYVLLKRI